MDLWFQFLFVQLCPNTAVTYRWAVQSFDILHNFNATNVIACCFTHHFICHLRSIHAARWYLRQKSISFEHSHQYPFSSFWDEVICLCCTTWTPSQRPTNYHYIITVSRSCSHFPTEWMGLYALKSSLFLLFVIWYVISHHFSLYLIIYLVLFCFSALLLSLCQPEHYCLISDLTFPLHHFLLPHLSKIGINKIEMIKDQRSHLHNRQHSRNALCGCNKLRAFVANYTLEF